MDTAFLPVNSMLSLLVSSGSLPKGSVVRITCKKGKLVDDHRNGDSLVVFMEEGSVDVFSIAPDGTEVLLSILHKGEAFGISNLFEEKELCTVMQCSSDCILLTVPKTLLREALMHDPRGMAAYAQLCNRKIQFLINRIGQLTLNSAKLKVVEYLLRNTSVEQPVLALTPKEDLRLPLGISRATLFRILAGLQDSGAVYSTGSQIRVVNRKLLEEQFREYT
ncbi:MAG: Crp/Fnr family transcriptional regulator [Sphaerochaetaceae bacterium]